MSPQAARPGSIIWLIHDRLSEEHSYPGEFAERSATPPEAFTVSARLADLHSKEGRPSVPPPYRRPGNSSRLNTGQLIREGVAL